jgi:ATP-dependent Clp protease adaptor protein ClpS
MRDQNREGVGGLFRTNDLPVGCVVGQNGVPTPAPACAASDYVTKGIALAVSTAFAEPEVQTAVRPREEKHTKPKHQPRYHVVLWNDDDHTYDYVVAMMKELFGHSAEKGFQIAEQVDKQGRAICLTTTKEHAELKRDQIHAYGKDPRLPKCQGSMSATIEPETTES